MGTWLRQQHSRLGGISRSFSALIAVVVIVALPNLLHAAKKCPAVVAFEKAEKDAKKADDALKAKVKAKLEEELEQIEDAYKEAKDTLESAQSGSNDANQKFSKFKQSGNYKEHGSKLKFNYETADALVKKLEGLIQSASFWQGIEAGKTWTATAEWAWKA